MQTVRIGIIGGGLMGREIASTFARWCAVLDTNIIPRLTAVADLNPNALAWFKSIPSATLLTDNYQKLLASPEVDVVYVALPHHLHKKVYLDTLNAGKDLLAEKPFGIDLDAAQTIHDATLSLNRFVRCSSEFPFIPGAQRVYEAAHSGSLGRILEVTSGFHHSSDLDPDKPANWKRQNATCGEIGVMGDLGMHVAHLPLRLGWNPTSVYAQLQKGFPQRPDGKGGTTVCETWDNATLHTWFQPADQSDPAPLRLEMKRLAPGQTNTWFIEVLGTKGGARFSSTTPKTLWTFTINPKTKEQLWQKSDLGFQTPFKTVTGGIFEPGFPDLIQQMWAAYLTERAGSLGDRFACVAPAEALASHQIWNAALKSQADQAVVPIQ
ncbi:MAG: Gfo/Idh/MocA family oxidoreductase [Verrucomicrobiota bacterium]